MSNETEIVGKFSRGEDMVNVLPPSFRNFTQVYLKFKDVIDLNPNDTSFTWFESYGTYRQGYRFDLHFLQKKYIAELREGVTNILSGTKNEMDYDLARFLKYNLKIE